ncbi:MAG: bacterial Ig-like domain-containing protein, partial [Candidatus Gallimonas sp.]
ISGFDTSSYGLKTATVTYAGLLVEYAYAVAEVESVEVASAPAKLVYELGEKADVTGLTVKVNFFYTENGERKTGEFTLPVTEKMVSLDTSVGNLEARLVITFEGKETYAEVKVRAVESIVLNTENVKKSYYERGLLNVEGLTAEVTYNTGDRETVTVTEEMVSGFDSSVPVEKQTLTVTYRGQTATYEVEIKKLPDTDDPSGGGDTGNKGCGGSISASGILVLSAIAAVAAVIRKKEDR